MGLVTPDIGLIFWMVLSFTILVFVLKKYAWKPILTALHTRETAIENALNRAEEAKQEMLTLQAGNENILKQAVLEREKIVREAREMRENIIAEAKKTAHDESVRMKKNALEEIEHQKLLAIKEMHDAVATLSVDIAEKVLKDILADSTTQKTLVDKYVKDLKFN